MGNFKQELKEAILIETTTQLQYMEHKNKITYEDINEFIDDINTITNIVLDDLLKKLKKQGINEIYLKVSKEVKNKIKNN